MGYKVGDSLHMKCPECGADVEIDYLPCFGPDRRQIVAYETVVYHDQCNFEKALGFRKLKN